MKLHWKTISIYPISPSPTSMGFREQVNLDGEMEYNAIVRIQDKKCLNAIYKIEYIIDFLVFMLLPFINQIKPFWCLCIGQLQPCERIKDVFMYRGITFTIGKSQVFHLEDQETSLFIWCVTQNWLFTGVLISVEGLQKPMCKWKIHSKCCYISRETTSYICLKSNIINLGRKQSFKIWFKEICCMNQTCNRVKIFNRILRSQQLDTCII